MKDRVRGILTDLERVREGLLALSDDMWNSIDHKDATARRQGVEYMDTFDNQVEAVKGIEGWLSKLFEVELAPPSESRPRAGSVVRSREANERIIHELNRETPHFLREDFRYKVPYGYMLQGEGAGNITTWRHLYELVCQQLAAQYPDKFQSALLSPRFRGGLRNKVFSRNRSDFIAAVDVGNGLFIEGNLSARDITKRLARLLEALDIAPEKLRLYLSEDRDAKR